jgi:tetraacyldisaccharide 4'-kinase
MKSKRFEKYFVEVIKNQRTGFFATIFKFFLRIFSWCFQLIVLLRNWAFDRGWLRRFYPPVPLVISVGNIVAGGTGKTPVTLMLAKEFCDSMNLAILSRGYRSNSERSSAPIWLSKGDGPMHPASFCGDEPFLLANNLPKSFVIVGKDRHKASIMAAKAGAKMIIMDDGMQHRHLARDFEIVVMNARDLFGQGYFLPRGFLRERRSSLKRADLIVLNHAESTEIYDACQSQIAQYSKAPIVAMQMEVVGVFDFKGEKVESLQGKRVGIFCSIAYPEYFETTVKNQGAEIIARHILADHQHFDLHALDIFAHHCLKQGIEILLCTEKDKVKFTDSFQLCLPTAWLQIELRIQKGESDWQSFISSAKDHVNKCV